jgi:DNA-binding response OmpR family regulator
LSVIERGRQVGHSLAPIVFLLVARGGTRAHRTSMATRTNLKTKTVLVVDGASEQRKAVERTLTREGFEVVELPHAERLVEIVEKHRPDLVLLQLATKSSTVVAMVRLLRAAGCGVPVVILSPDVDDARATEALEAGADAFLTASTSPRILAAHIQAIIRRVGFCAEELAIVVSEDAISMLPS